MPVCQITERVALDTAARVDRQAGVIRGVRVLGMESSNGRFYPEATLRRAVPMYDNAVVMCDHPKRPTDPRSVLERIGLLVRPRFEVDAIRADLRLTKGHRLYEALLDSAEFDAGAGWGLSHNADASTRRNPDGTEVITEILEVRSVDLVDAPATNRSLFESRGLDLNDPRQLARWVTTPDKPAAVRKRQRLLEARQRPKASQPPNTLDPAALGRWVRS